MTRLHVTPLDLVGNGDEDMFALAMTKSELFLVGITLQQRVAALKQRQKRGLVYDEKAMAALQRVLMRVHEFRKHLPFSERSRALN